MKSSVRERLHRGLVELVKTPQRLPEGQAKAPGRLREASVVAMRRAGVMEHSRGLHGASVVTRGATMVASRSLWRHLDATDNLLNNDRPCIWHCII